MGKMAIFIDYSNMHLLAHNLYAHHLDRWTTHLNPVAVAEKISQLRGPLSALDEFHLYRGRSDYNRDPEAAVVFRDEWSRWHRDPRMTTHFEPMLYGSSMSRPKESGVDMKLGLDFVDAARSNKFSRIALFSGDSDFMPAIDEAVKTGTRLELVAWTDGGDVLGNALVGLCRAKNYRLWTHRFDVDDFWASQDLPLRTAA